MSALRPTIAAISSGSGGGVGIVRVSGPQAAAIAQQICRPLPHEIVSHHLYLGRVFAPAAADPGGPPTISATMLPPAPQPTGQKREEQGPAAASPRTPREGDAVDQVLFCLMRGPHSYTGEDVLELHGHGGARNLRRLLDACLAAGAQPAGPGEFTRRAFLAGKLDLTAAEAVATLIEAQSDQALRQAQRQLAGELGQKVAELRRQVVTLLADFEGLLDFPDAEPWEHGDQAILADSRRRLQAVHAATSALSSSFAQGGKAIASGIEIAVLGRPNAGKSSLINALCGSERVIVDAQPGTTRDFVEVRSDWAAGGAATATILPVTLIDTAGDHGAATPLEQHGLRLARQRWQNVDLLLFLVDGSVGMTADDERLYASLPGEPPHLVVWNKIDRSGGPPPPAELAAIPCSALCGWGLENLRQSVLSRLAPRLASSDEVLVTSARQAALLQQAATALQNSLEALGQWQHCAPELVAGELRVAAARLAELSGDEISEGLLDAIFARFCVGK
jgi:tRNA modification GTPase